MVTELCEAGDLAKWLKRRGKLNESEAKIIMRKIVDAIAFIHKNSNKKTKNFNKIFGDILFDFIKKILYTGM